MQQQVIEEIAKHLGVTVQDIDLNASLSEDLGLGPMEQADLLNAVSVKFNITFDPQDIENVSTVHDIIVMVEDLSLEQL